MLTSGALTPRPRRPVATFARLKSSVAMTLADCPTWETTLAALAVTEVPRFRMFTVVAALLLMACGMYGTAPEMNELVLSGERLIPALPVIVPSVPRRLVTRPRLFRGQATDPVQLPRRLLARAVG